MNLDTLLQLSGSLEESRHRIKFNIDGERAYRAVIDQFGDQIDREGDMMVVDFPVYKKIEALVHDFNGVIETVEQTNENESEEDMILAQSGWVPAGIGMWSHPKHQGYLLDDNSGRPSLYNEYNDLIGWYDSHEEASDRAVMDIEAHKKKYAHLDESMSITTTVDDNGDKSMNISASGTDAEELAQILQLSGQQSCGCQAMDSEIEEGTQDNPGKEWPGYSKAGFENVDEEYENTPKPRYSDVDTEMVVRSGGLNRPKKQYKNYRMGDNLMAVEETINRKWSNFKAK